MTTIALIGTFIHFCETELHLPQQQWRSRCADLRQVPMAMDRFRTVYRHSGRHIGKLRVMSALLAACRPPGSLHGLAKEHDSRGSCDPHLSDVGEASAPHVNR